MLYAMLLIYLWQIIPKDIWQIKIWDVIYFNKKSLGRGIKYEYIIKIIYQYWRGCSNV